MAGVKCLKSQRGRVGKQGGGESRCQTRPEHCPPCLPPPLLPPWPRCSSSQAAAAAHSAPLRPAPPRPGAWGGGRGDMGERAGVGRCVGAESSCVWRGGPVVPAGPGDSHLWHAPPAPTLTWPGRGGAGRGSAFVLGVDERRAAHHKGTSSGQVMVGPLRGLGGTGHPSPSLAAELSPSRLADRCPATAAYVPRGGAALCWAGGGVG